MWSFDISFIVSLIKLLKKNNVVTGDLRCHGAHVMSLWWLGRIWGANRKYMTRFILASLLGNYPSLANKGKCNGLTGDIIPMVVPVIGDHCTVFIAHIVRLHAGPVVIVATVTELRPGEVTLAINVIETNPPIIGHAGFCKKIDKAVTLDFSSSPIGFQWGFRKYPG